jgi:hypothetical protein
MKYVLRPLTDTSWILLGDGNRLGLVNSVDDKITVIGKIEPKYYDSIADLQNKLGSKIVIEKTTPSVKELELGEVFGFPVKHNSTHELIEEPVPNYLRSAKSRDRYAAGYYAIKFANGWTPWFCPRLTTIAEHEFLGPFKTKIEMNHQISSKNKERAL